MYDPTVTEQHREQVQKRIKARQLQILAEKKEHVRAQEIRRLAREFLVNNHYVSGTRIDMLNHAINNATRIYDDVEAFEIEPSGVPL
jgi:hypothetical protein